MVEIAFIGKTQSQNTDGYLVKLHDIPNNCMQNLKSAFSSHLLLFKDKYIDINN